MISLEGWSADARSIRDWLDESRSRRQERGRSENEALRERMAEAQAAGREMHAEIISSALHKKSIAHTRRQRERELAEQELDRKKVGAAIRRTVRELERATESGTAAIFEFEPSNRPKSPLRRERDLYWEWICRGFSSGEAKGFKRDGKPRSLARQAKWSREEFQDKIAYIEREDALEQVAGNLISNMGEDQGERLGCASRIEELETLNRTNANVYVHSILALPAKLSPEGRAQLLKDICDHYARLRLPFAAALHRPSPHNSQKNFHAHILVSLRPMEREAGQWVFAPRKLAWLNTVAGLRLQRRFISQAFNRALKAEQSKERYTHRSRIRDGIAPGGFTKWAGVQFAPQDAGALGNFLEAEAQVAAADKLVEVANDLVKVSDKLETLEKKHSALEFALNERQALANSQAAGESPGRDREPGTADAQKADDGQEALKVASEERADANPFEELEELIRLRFRRLRDRRQAETDPILIGAIPYPAAKIVDTLEAYYLDGTIVLTRHEGQLQASFGAPGPEAIVRQIANSQVGYELLAETASLMHGVDLPQPSAPQPIVSPQEAYEAATLALRAQRGTNFEQTGG